MSASIREIVDEAQRVVGEVAGSGVQTFSDDRMMSDAIAVFDMLHKKIFWPQFIDWFDLQLDGTTGRPVDATAFNYVRDFEDIFVVYEGGTERILTPVPRNRNPFLIRGNRQMHFRSIPANDPDFIGRRIEILPKTAIGNVQVGVRIYPLTRDDSSPEHDWDWSDIMELDKWMLVHGVAWKTLSSDDLNPGAAADQQAAMEGRFNDITNNMASQPIRVEGSGGIPSGWFVNP